MWSSAVRDLVFARSRIAASRPSGLLSAGYGIRFSSTDAPDSQTSSPAQRTPLPIRYPYFVNRVGENQHSLPVYLDLRNAGSRSLTLIRKVDGDVSALCRDLFEDFGWGDPFDKKNPDSDMLVRITHQAGSKKIFVRGNWTRDIKSWLEERGF